ncbi:hypothetical protein F0562_013610 [Nyssa sinensis]|uniref:GDP-L-galactose phosphorylase 1 n=1 Tax=Nyssa sinensis TaxID=561372 RepID=A0A5J4ZNF2_9ASTE|nr:hypothetical protein F0562_013610 [Nyssa sinensis]
MNQAANASQPTSSRFRRRKGWPATGVRIPIYRFGTESLMDNGFSEGPSYIPEEDQSMLDLLLLAQWEDRMWKGLFRYDVTTSEIKLIGGRRKFLAQLNEQWNKDYLTEPDNNKVCYQGDPFICNWMKHHEELLFCAASGEKADPELIPAAAVPHGAIFVILNASPVEYGHVFVVPGGFNSLHAFLDARSLELVMRFAVEINNSSFRLFYECSTPSASHIYFQACYFPNPLPVELMPVVTFFSEGQGGVQICGVTDYPIKAFMFTSNGNLKVLVQLLAEICYCLREKNISYNLLISDSSKKIFLFPLLQCTLSAWECGGYFLFKSRCDFDHSTEEAMLKCLGAVSLDDEGFQVVKQLCCRVASQLAS